MNKKFIFSLLTIVMCLIIVGCGKKENNLNNSTNVNLNSNSNSTQVNENTNTNDNTPTNVVVDDEIIDVDESDNVPMDNTPVVVSEVINCDGCVFAYFSDEGDKAKTLGSTVSLSEYTTDVNNLKTSGGKQRHNFFGLVLSGNTISRAYACVLKDDKIYCIEGSTNGAYHSSNIGILNQFFSGNQCKTLSDGHNYWCTDGSYNGNSKTSGYTSMHYETSCTIYGSDSNTGKLICH
jgi:hypothetical protein